MIKERRKKRRMTRRGGEKRGVIKRKRNIKKTFFRVPFFFPSAVYLAEVFLK